MAVPVKKSIAIALAAAGLVASGVGAWSWTQRPPVEVRALETVLRRLSRGNDLGSQPIALGLHPFRELTSGLGWVGHR